ncbi:MAG: hypothetical protein QOG91_269 [Candidatus Parcubacteria bacterium]|jgi:predicted ATPase|nr:hypothetical protein [Candidatus Parcubacteria bacterium]
MKNGANNWYVITGASSSGKTTVVKSLEAKGYKVVYETARVLIEQGLQKGLTVAAIRKDEQAFQNEVLAMKIEIEKALDPGELVFLDRAIPDTWAYDMLYHAPHNALPEANMRPGVYKEIFLLDRLPYAPDNVRVETKEQQDKLHELIETIYRKLNYEPVNVPVLPVEKRVGFILSHL